jgi:uncharacterized Zn finger protein
MMPCKFCGPTDEAGVFRTGIKQIGKTRTDGVHFARMYRCRDCGATLQMSGDLRTKEIVEEWLLNGVPPTIH